MKIILASHGSLAKAMLEVLHMIMGDEDNVEAFCLDTYENPVALSEAVKKKIEAAQGGAQGAAHDGAQGEHNGAQGAQGEPIVMACDIKGGSIFNHLLPFCSIPGVSLFAGMNLNLVLSLANIQPQTEADFIEVTGEGKDGIELFNREVLERMNNEDDDF